MPGGYGLGAHHLPSAYAILGRGGSGPGFGGHTPASAPPPPPYSHSSLGTLSVAASQAASLGNYVSFRHSTQTPIFITSLNSKLVEKNTNSNFKNSRKLSNICHMVITSILNQLW